MRKLVVLATLVAAFFALPAVASAGCNTYQQVNSDGVTLAWSDYGTPANHTDDVVYVAGDLGAYCPSANTNLYHYNLYAQELIGSTWGEPTPLASQWSQSDTWRNSATYPGWPYFLNLDGGAFWLCDDYTQAAVRTRVRYKVVNETTGSVSPMAYSSPELVLPSTCY